MMARLGLLEELQDKAKDIPRPIRLERTQKRRSSVRLDSIERVLDALLPESGTVEGAVDA